MLWLVGRRALPGSDPTCQCAVDPLSVAAGYGCHLITANFEENMLLVCWSECVVEWMWWSGCTVDGFEQSRTCGRQGVALAFFEGKSILVHANKGYAWLQSHDGLDGSADTL